MEGGMVCSLIAIGPSWRLLASSSAQPFVNSASTQMATETQTYTTIELLTPNGAEIRRASTAPARSPWDDKIPLIDLTSLDGDLDARKRIAQHVRNAAQNTGFFYVQNHGIDHELIEDALTQAKAFFAQSPEQK
jgi:hypothetical protein